MATERRTWDWELEAWALVAPALGRDAEGRWATEPATHAQVVTAIRLTAAA